MSTLALAADRSTSVVEGAGATVARRRGRGRVPTYVALTCLGLFSVGPIILFFFNAVKSQQDYARSSLGPPDTWRWANFSAAWTQANMTAGIVNSAIVVIGTAAATCLVAGSAAYALARLRIRGGSTFMTYLLVTGALPAQLFLVPLFYAWAKAGLYDTRIGLIIIYVGLFSPFATLLLRSFMLTLPREFEEAARIDGAGEFSVLVEVVLPNSLPGLLTVALVTGLSAYNEFLFAVTFIQDPDLLPLSTTFFTFQQGFSQNYTLVSAAGFIMIAPMLILFLVLQRRFIDGLSSSGLGGV